MRSARPAPLRPDAALRTLRVIHAALLLLLVGFGVVAWVAAPRDFSDLPEGSRPSFHSLSLIFYVLGGISVAMCAAMPVIRTRLIPRLPHGVTVAGGPEALARARTHLLRALINGNLFSWGLACSIGVYGLVLAMMLGAPWPYPVFAAPAACALAVMRPRRGPIDAIASMKNRD